VGHTSLSQEREKARENRGHPRRKRAARNQKATRGGGSLSEKRERKREHTWLGKEKKTGRERLALKEGTGGKLRAGSQRSKREGVTRDVLQGYSPLRPKKIPGRKVEWKSRLWPYCGGGGKRGLIFKGGNVNALLWETPSHTGKQKRKGGGRRGLATIAVKGTRSLFGNQWV